MMNRRNLIAALAALAASPAAAQTAGADGMRIVLVGTSGPLPVRDRAKPCVAILVGGGLYLVDVGPESTENMMSWRLPVASARAVFLSHLHSDHIGDLGEFNMQSWVQGRERPLALVGPSGSTKSRAGSTRPTRTTTASGAPTMNATVSASPSPPARSSPGSSASRQAPPPRPPGATGT
jgi:ribonuclease BN (tRNA processing enzyme)